MEENFRKVQAEINSVIGRTKEEIWEQIYFQEQYFDSEIVM